ncbi:hypothetical protein [Mesorhizobium sp.]|uniref:hypothetical protein n=1 Tax=Mesorhizobium sp. TaxID=1871066 RepID=UPI000FE7410E|nr:hypothetical protein [Mesorhizobium sp.]RWM22762.1 MAG: hypothetical protein EOR74_27045 [Mesorhizobium sp.]RWM33764.1 MAG: hypothetical protein EOR75_27305 [Mesorhizobium sp.]TIO74299.1 MAG: hypothetical protein E5X75_24590 [Mesorhizobium sp.]TIO82164.1 MAG: hypothetical protein E5X74_25790 [Mesorhizobium sp.]TJV49189.1 MAG: hypothetical protein E5Y01_24905 [Mesorhizobium sp.]
MRSNGGNTEHISVVLRLLAWLIILASASVNQAASATIFPAEVTYSNRTEETEETKACEIILDASNPPSREAVKFVAFAGYNKHDGGVVAGFLMAAADLTASDKYQMVQISDVAFSSRAFTSLDHLNYEAYEDGTVMAATQAPVLAAAFVNAVLAGTYEVRFARSDSRREMRTYKIASPPEEAVRNSFVHCLELFANESSRIWRNI